MKSDLRHYLIYSGTPDELTTVYLGSYLSRLTPTTNMGASAEGAEMMTFLAPPFKWAEAFSTVVKTPVDSTM